MIHVHGQIKSKNMTRPGPKPKPTELKILAGTYRADRAPGGRGIDAAQAAGLPPLAKTAPRGLLPLARKFWKEHAPRLSQLGILTDLDAAAFAMLATHWAIAFDAARRIREEGLAAEDKNGAVRKHPLLPVLRDNSAAFRQYAAEFGLTPSVRTRLKIPDPPDQDGFFGF